MSDRVTLRPFRPEDVDHFLAETRNAEQTGPLQWFGFRDGLPALRREYDETGFLTADRGRLVVDHDGAYAGRVSWWKSSWGPPATSWCWQFGILLPPDRRGRGIGTRAQQALADYLFAHTTANRIEAVTDVANVAEQRALEKAGFNREGVVRGAQWRGGKWHDQLLYSRLRSDPTPGRL